MNIVALLEDSARQLPVGDYSTGLNAIVRHVKTAIRHLERDREHDPDSCTDVIYRTNQAYEGSLKEAYRVLAGKDPSGLSPFQIEGYLENNAVVRPRVLTQLTRYRQDYRNPSTHDYKLDFDEDEALLAIVSVCAFARLLFNQIASKLASQAAQSRVAPQEKPSPRTSLRSLSKRIAEVCLAYTKESTDVGDFEYEKGLMESLQSVGFDAKEGGFTMNEEEDAEIWDIIVKKGRNYFGIDRRPALYTTGRTISAEHLSHFMEEKECSGALLIIRSAGDAEYKAFVGSVAGKPAYVICEETDEQMDVISNGIADLKIVV